MLLEEIEVCASKQVVLVRGGVDHGAAPDRVHLRVVRGAHGEEVLVLREGLAAVPAGRREHVGEALPRLDVPFEIALQNV